MWLRRRWVAVGLVMVGCLGRAHALSPTIDLDGDGFVDAIETGLGSPTSDGTKTPESVAVATSCLDGADNDGDGSTDLDDPGCTVPAPLTGSFPSGGLDIFDSSLELNDYPFVVPGGTCLVTLEGSGPVIVARGTRDPGVGGLAVLPVEIVAMQLAGTASVGGSGCPVGPGTFPVTIIEHRAKSSGGEVQDTNASPDQDFPADSFFDIFVEIDLEGLVLEGGPPNGSPGTPIHVENTGITTLPPYNSGRNPNCYAVAGLPHEHCPKAPADHYLCYTGKFPRTQKRTVTVRDQFDDVAQDTQVLEPILFCNPAAKGAEPMFDDTGHLQCYRVKPRKVEENVNVRTQFGAGDAETKKTQVLCVPSQKDDLPPPERLNHFQCYRTKFRQPKVLRDVQLVDQFGTVGATVAKRQWLCNPADKNDEGIPNPLEHLECATLKPRTKVPKTVTVRNQFGEGVVKIKRAVMLCTPARKLELDGATTTTTTPGGTTTTTVPCPDPPCGGRAVALDQPVGSVPAGNLICLDQIVEGGCVAEPDACTGPHLHGQPRFMIGDEIVGPVPDPNQPECGFGQIEVSEFCGPDAVPNCGQ